MEATVAVLPGAARSKPAVIAVALAIVLAVALAIALTVVRRHDVAAAQKLAGWTAAVVAEQTARSLQTVDSRLDVVADALSGLEQSGTLNEDSARQMLRAKLQGLPYVRAIWAIAPDGRIVYDSDVGNIGAYLGDRDYFVAQRSQREQDLYVGHPVRSRSIGTWLLGASKAVHSPDGTLRYVIAASVEPAFFDSVWRKIDLGSGGAIALFSTSGTLMMRSPPDDGSMGRDFSQLPLFREQLPRGDAGVFRTHSPLDHVDRITGYRTLPGYPQLVVSVGLPLDRVLAPVTQLGWLAAGAWLAAVALGAVAVVRMERQGSRLRHQAEMLAMAGQVAGVAPWVADLERGEMFCSEQAATMLELPVHGPTSVGVMLARMSPESAATVRQALHDAKSTGKGYDLEIEFTTDSGRRLWLRCMAQAVRERAGGGTWLLGTKQDVTERRKLVEEVRALNTDLEAKVAQRTQELQEARRVADAANEAKSAFLANVSHEIRTPVGAILGLTRMLRRQGAATDQAGRLQQIEDSGQHLLALINDILDLSKIEAGRLELDAADFALRRTVDEVVALVRPQAEAKGLRLECEPGDLPARAVGDSTRVRQLLFNYLGNAIKFTDTGGVCLRCGTLAMSDHAVVLRFEVSDTGVGIAPDKLPALFQPFEQADASSSRRAGGTGLGLAVNRHLAHLMGGETGANSVPGQGSVFWCTLRLGRSEGAVAGADSSASDADLLARLRSGHGGLRALLVEDSAVGAEVTTDLLEEAGFAVDLARDGAEAVDRARTQVYDFVLMDMQMPRMDGMAATRAIRALPGWQRPPIIALTANVFAADRGLCESAGMNDFLTKPLQPGELYRTLLRWLEPAAAGHDATGVAEAPSGPAASTAMARGELERIAGCRGMDSRRVLAFRATATRYLELLSAFLARHAQAARALRACLDKQDTAGASRLAHSLAGDAAVLGADAIWRSAIAVEDGLRLADHLPSSLEPVFADLEELEHALAELAR